MEIGEISWNGLLPVIAFLISACVITLVRSLARTNKKLQLDVGVFLTIATSVFVILTSAIRWRQFDVEILEDIDQFTLNEVVRVDRLTSMSAIVFSFLAIVASLLSLSYLKKREDIPAAEFFVLLNIVVVGMISMVMANDLIAMFVALEVFSIPLYVLTAFDRRRGRSLEAGFKYFILGATSSAILLYGIALNYGVTGTTAFTGASSSSTVAAVSTVLIMVGLLFKVAAFPFHFWAPDAYEGAPSIITTFMAGATKLAAFAVFARLVESGVIDVSASGASARLVLSITAIASAIFGPIVALRQSSMKRALGYTWIAHSAYIMLALKGGTQQSLQSVITYSIIYAVVIAGTFAVTSIISGPNESNDSLESFKGLAVNNPFLAASLTVFLFAQAGIPLTAGFIAKFDVFRVSFANEFYISGIIVLISTVIAAAFYLRIVLAMYSKSFSEKDVSKDSDVQEKLEVATSAKIAIAMCVVLTIAVGVIPSLLTGFTHALF